MAIVPLFHQGLARSVRTSLRIAAVGLGTYIGILATTASAGDPRLSSFGPLGGARGSEVEVRVNGARLADADGLLFYGEGITVKEVKPLKDNENACLMTLVIAPDCRLGLHPMRVRTRSGLSNLKHFTVGALAHVTEKEPNNDRATAQPIELDTTVNGAIAGEEIDFYVVEARQGERITAEVEAIRLGRDLFDPLVTIFDEQDRELASSDDVALLFADCVASIVAPANGKYFIAVRESTFTNGSPYRLHVGRFPRPRAIYPAGGKIGETVALKLIGDVAGEQTMSLTLPTEVRDEFAVFAQDKLGIAPSPNPFRLTKHPGVLEAEPNDDVGHATPGAVPGTFNGIVSVRGDVDHFKFAAKKGQQYEVQLYGRSLRSPIDSFVQILRANGAAIASNDDTGLWPDSALRFTAPADEDCVLLVKDMLSDGSPEHVYHIEIKPLEPSLALGLPELKRYEDIVAEVPQGNRMAVMLNVARRDCNGEVQLDLRDLPAGVSAEVVTVPGNESTTPVLLTAVDDAVLAGSLVDVVGRLTVKQGSTEQIVEGRLSQESQLVRGPNNRAMVTYQGRRMATAVTQRVPFKLELIEPRVPLVRNGAMDLKVRVVRDADFNLPITLRMVYNPPGVSSSGAVKIAESQTEGIMPLTANKDAAPGKYKVAVVGEVTLPGGVVGAATQFVNLEVAEPFFSFAYKPVAVEQGKQTEFVIEVDVDKPFEGQATAELLGLPAEATAEKVEFGSSAETIKFIVKTTGKTAGGRHKALMCRAVVMVHGEPVIHILGPGELRVDAPIQKQTPASAKSAPAAK